VFFRDFVVAALCCSSSCAALFDSRLVTVFVYSFWKINFSQSITISINELDVNVTAPEAWVLWWFKFYYIICRHYTVACY